MKTPIESLIESLSTFIDRTKVSDTMLHNIVEEHLVMEKVRIEDVFNESRKTHPMLGFKYKTFDEYNHETFKTE